jgi:hypothetical protein
MPLFFLSLCFQVSDNNDAFATVCGWGSAAAASAASSGIGGSRNASDGAGTVTTSPPAARAT